MLGGFYAMLTSGSKTKKAGRSKGKKSGSKKRSMSKMSKRKSSSSLRKRKPKTKKASKSRKMKGGATYSFDLSGKPIGGLPAVVRSHNDCSGVHHK